MPPSEQCIDGKAFNLGSGIPPVRPWNSFVVCRYRVFTGPRSVMFLAVLSHGNDFLWLNPLAFPTSAGVVQDAWPVSLLTKYARRTTGCTSFSQLPMRFPGSCSIRASFLEDTLFGVTLPRKHPTRTSERLSWPIEQKHRIASCVGIDLPTTTAVELHATPPCQNLGKDATTIAKEIPSSLFGKNESRTDTHRFRMCLEVSSVGYKRAYLETRRPIDVPLDQNNKPPTACTMFRIEQDGAPTKPSRNMTTATKIQNPQLVVESKGTGSLAKRAFHARRHTSPPWRPTPASRWTSSCSWGP